MCYLPPNKHFLHRNTCNPQRSVETHLNTIPRGPVAFSHAVSNESGDRRGLYAAAALEILVVVIAHANRESAWPLWA